MKNRKYTLPALSRYFFEIKKGETEYLSKRRAFKQGLRPNKRRVSWHGRIIHLSLPYQAPFNSPIFLFSPNNNSPEVSCYNEQLFGVISTLSHLNTRTL